MSAIDCGNTVHIADYYDIPVYWPIQEQNRQGVTGLPHDALKVLTKNDIVIGGGSGEHSAMVINIDYAISTLASIVDNMYFSTNNNYLDKGSWNIIELIDLYNKMHHKDLLMSFETTILTNIAAFVIAEMPLKECIVDPEILKYAQSKLKELPWDYFNGFSGVLNSQKFGSIFIDDPNNPGSTITKWGYSLNDWYNDNGGRK